MSIRATYNKGINHYTHYPPSKNSHSYWQMKSWNLGFGFLTLADLLIGTSGVVEDFTTKDESLLVTHVEVCSATPVVVVIVKIGLFQKVNYCGIIGITRATQFSERNKSHQQYINKTENININGDISTLLLVDY